MILFASLGKEQMQECMELEIYAQVCIVLTEIKFEMNEGWILLLDMHLNRNGLRYMEGFWQSMYVLCWGETLALFAIGLILNNEFQGTARSLEEIAKQPWSRAAGQGHMLKHMLKCNKYDNCILGRKGKSGKLFVTWLSINLWLKLTCRWWVAWWLINCMELGGEYELVYS